MFRRWKGPAPRSEKSEMSDLKAKLRDPAAERDPAQRREALKQVVAYMTLGIDTSALAPDVIMAAATKDLVCKKMVYLYMATYADVSPDITLMAISTLQKDCHDESPIVRGLALRTVSSLRLPSGAEHILPLLNRALTDSSAYVKKTAILAALRLFKTDRQQFHALDPMERLESMVRDSDPAVCMNAISALEEIHANEGGIKVTKSLIYFLLNRRDLTEWQQCTVLELLLRYDVASDEEMFTIMNRLEERLRGSNTALILGTTRVFLQLTAPHPGLHQQVFLRVREPLLTLFATTPVETAYTVLSHIRLLLDREPSVFQDCYRDFFVRMTDPTYMKELKMEVLRTVVTEASASVLVDEFVQLVGDINPHISRKAVRCLASVAHRVSSVLPQVAEFLQEWLESDVVYTRNEAILAIRDLVRKYPDSTLLDPIFEKIGQCDGFLGEPESTLAFIWVLGRFPKRIPQAPYLLEDLVESWKELSADARVQLLVSCARCFFVRAPETEKALSRTLKLAVEDEDDVRVRDRALMYFRLLRGNVKEAESVICVDPSVTSAFADEDLTELYDALFDEFNTFSVVYGKVAARFVNDDTDALDSEVGTQSDADDEELHALQDESQEDQLEHSLSVNKEDAVAPTHGQRKTRLILSSEPVISEARFAALWGELPLAETVSVQLRAQPPLDLFEGSLARNNILCLAGGSPDGVLKGYFYAQVQPGEEHSYFLTEILISAEGPSCGGGGVIDEAPVEGALTATVKSDAPDDVQGFVSLVRDALHIFR